MTRVTSDLCDLICFCSCCQPRSSSDSHPVGAQEGPITEGHPQQTPKEEEEEDGKRTEDEEDEKKEEQKGVVEEEEKKEEQKGAEEKEEEKEEEEASEVDQSLVSEGVSEEFALSSTLPQEEKEEERLPS